MLAQPPGMSPSPQVLETHVFTCTVCSHTWIEFTAEAGGTCHCALPRLKHVQSIRIQIQPPKRIEIPPLLGVKNAPPSV